MLRRGMRTACGLVAVALAVPAAAFGADGLEHPPELVDTPPETTIDSSPPARTNSTSARFTFSSSEPGPSEPAPGFSCTLDGQPVVPCTSPLDLNGLSEGEHTFEVAAIDGTLNTDATPATFTWTVDLTPPGAEITSGPSGETEETNATFAFRSEPGATLECALDGAAFQNCSSEKSYAGIQPGEHTFQVRATDAAGNSSTASHRWTVRAPAQQPSNGESAPTPAIADSPPLLGVSIPRAALRRASFTRGLSATLTCDEFCLVDAWLTVDGTRAKRLGLSRTRRPVVVGTAFVQLNGTRAGVVTVKLTRRARRALRRSKSVKVSLNLRATDSIGQSTPLRKRGVTLRRR